VLELHAHLQEDHDNLLAKYRALEMAFDEVTSLNAQLAAQLRQAKQQRAPVRFGSLMGMP
jgi:hypothetical protein